MHIGHKRPTHHSIKHVNPEEKESRIKHLLRKVTKKDRRFSKVETIRKVPQQPLKDDTEFFTNDSIYELKAKEPKKNTKVSFGGEEIIMPKSESDLQLVPYVSKNMLISNVKNENQLREFQWHFKIILFTFLLAMIF
eukprot:NODE_211_length_12764_cov_0.923727.p7 type:complete len:137 gc:universal NODE_211_length_12764_cov_0.923727:5026-5436(+)